MTRKDIYQERTNKIMIKILTYQSFGGIIPTVVRDFAAAMPDTDLRTSQALADFVMSFKGNPVGNRYSDDIKAEPDKLFFNRSTTGPYGIVRNEFYGWSEDSRLLATVCVNEYDPEKLKVTVEEYDGAEALVLLPEYDPVDGVPGLYARRPNP